MSVTSIYPVIATTDVRDVADFFRDHLDFETTFETDWYVSLRHGAWELAVLDARHETIPASARGAATSGLIVNIEVEDVDAVHRRLVEEGPFEPLLTLRSETFGQRHFIIAAPGGTLVDVITPIPAGADYAEHFADGADVAP